jgi:hypothetical protein
VVRQFGKGTIIAIRPSSSGTVYDVQNEDRTTHYGLSLNYITGILPSTQGGGRKSKKRSFKRSFKRRMTRRK